MESSDETKLDDESEALPDQTDLRVELALEQRVLDAPRWMNAEERMGYYRRDLAQVFGEEYLAPDTSHQAIAKNFKRSSRKEAKPARIYTHESTTTNQSDLFGGAGE